MDTLKFGALKDYVNSGNLTQITYACISMILSLSNVVSVVPTCHLVEVELPELVLPLVLDEPVVLLGVEGVLTEGLDVVGRLVGRHAPDAQTRRLRLTLLPGTVGRGHLGDDGGHCRRAELVLLIGQQSI